MGAKSKVKKSKDKKKKKGGLKQKKQNRLSKIRGTASDPCSRSSRLRGF
jgi:hypothetical protein